MIQPLFPILILAIGDPDMDREEKAGGTKKRGRPPKKCNDVSIENACVRVLVLCVDGQDGTG